MLDATAPRVPPWVQVNVAKRVVIIVSGTMIQDQKELRPLNIAGVLLSCAGEHR